MRCIGAVLLGLGAVLLGACSGRSGTGGIAGAPSHLPPEDFLEAPISFGDLDDTSICFRTQQLVFHITGIESGWEWKKLDENTWEYTVPIHASGDRNGSARLRLARSGKMVRVIEYEEIVNGSVFTHGVGPGISGYVQSFRQTILQSGAQEIEGCPDPHYIQKRY